MKRYRIRKYRWFIVIMTIMIIAIVLFLFVDRSIKPVVISMSEAKVQYITTKAMNRAVKNILGENIEYTDLINILTDKNGKITMIQANTIKMNTLASETCSAALDEIRSIGNEGISIPIGSVFGSKIIAGLGPSIKVKMIPVGSISTNFDTEFENAGINQTRHKIYLNMQAQVRIVIPMGAKVITVSTRVPITETIIVGDVPEYYINVEDGNKKEDILNLVPETN